MQIVARPFLSIDAERIQQLYAAQQLDYEQPNWEDMMLSCVIEDDDKVEMAAFLRKTAEVYLLLDPKSSARKRERLGDLLILHRELLRPAQKQGLSDVHCWLPPQLDKQFGWMLQKSFGWEKQLWQPYRYPLSK